MNDDFQEKKHYYLVYFTFSENGKNGEANMIHSNNKGFVDSECLKSVHISIKEWLEESGVVPSAVVLNNFSYLGEMTEEEFGDMKSWQWSSL